MGSVAEWSAHQINENKIRYLPSAVIYSNNASGAEQMPEADNFYIKHNSVKNPNWPESNQLANNKCGRGFELGTATCYGELTNPANGHAERVLNLSFFFFVFLSFYYVT